MSALLRALIAVSMFGFFSGHAYGAAAVFEKTFESAKNYADPFNDVEVDIVFSRDGQSWRVPAFWRGGNRWTVRFAAPTPGEYSYRLESSDPSNVTFNGLQGRVHVTPYTGNNKLLRRGMLRVSANRRHFEHADGTPFFWLGDTWWSGLSDRLPWEGFQRLTADRKTKGFTVVQIAGGLVPGEEEPPLAPGYCNEGGCVWEKDFTRINPRYFDYADRRIDNMIENGLVPALVGGWYDVATEMGPTKLKQHWRYLIARYASYPIFWVIGGEIYQSRDGRGQDAERLGRTAGTWENVARYVRSIDPYHHPITTHEFPAPFHGGFVDQSITDFDLPQLSHFGWPSIAAEVAQITSLYARTPRKPVVQGEIGYEQLGQDHFPDFQRAAFWMAMLNGAAGHTYGAAGTWAAYSNDKPLHRKKWTFLTWEEGMNLPGSYQVGLNAKFLQQFRWERFEPHPEWITPRGTTLFEPSSDPRFFDLDLMRHQLKLIKLGRRTNDSQVPEGEWKRRDGTFWKPYVAGIPGEIRLVYLPNLGVLPPESVTILGLEPGVRYSAYYWDPTMGVKVDLGSVLRPEPGKVLFKQAGNSVGAWVSPVDGRQSPILLIKGISEKNVVVSTKIDPTRDAELILRYIDRANYTVIKYSAADQAIFLIEHVDGKDSLSLGKTDVAISGSNVRLIGELRESYGIASISDGTTHATSPIVALSSEPVAGRVGLSGGIGREAFEVRASPHIPEDKGLDRRLIDAKGVLRGMMSGTAEWDNYGRSKIVMLDAYRPEKVPFGQDWLLVLDAMQ